VPGTRRFIGRASGPVADTSGELQDREILRLLDQGLTAGMERLYDRCGARVYAIALSLVRDEAIAGELTMKVFLGVWRGARPSAHHRLTLSGWLVAAVLREARAMSPPVTGRNP
jgi:DNA-directed RNA polymerase specialized sigma24 family protein